MSQKHDRTLAAIFKTPTAKTLRWNELAGLLKSIDCEMLQRAGSRVMFVRGDVIARIHKPHPRPELEEYQVKDAREFLIAIGAQPEGE